MSLSSGNCMYGYDSLHLYDISITVALQGVTSLQTHTVTWLILHRSLSLHQNSSDPSRRGHQQYTVSLKTSRVRPPSPSRIRIPWCTVEPSLPQINTAHALSRPHEVKENVIHKSRPRSSIAPLVSILDAFSSRQEWAWAIWPVCVFWHLKITASSSSPV